MHRITILFAPDEEGYRTPAETLGQAFSRLGLDVVVKAAGEARFPDILASDIVIFGSEVVGSGALHPHFGEIVRTFEGVNLAGRLSGFLCYENNGASSLFRDALRDTDISFFQEDLVIRSDETSDKRIEAWAGKLYGRYEERHG